MSEKKELNKEELEKVSGGTIHPTVNSINWLYSKDAIVQIKLEDGTTTVDGKVSKRGYISLYLIGCVDFYYIESLTNTNINGWYSSEHIINNTSNISKRDLYYGVLEMPW